MFRVKAETKGTKSVNDRGLSIAWALTERHGRMRGF